MTYLQCLRARLDEEDRSRDGYYIRLNDGTKVGPLTGAMLLITPSASVLS